jgi:hypothetical protein
MEGLADEKEERREPTMRIDDRIEPLVRQALEGAVKRDGDRLDAALTAFPDETSRLAGLQLVVAICGMTLVELYGDKPSADDIQALADKVAEMEGWASITSGEVSTFLTALINATPLEQALSPERIVPLAFIVTASLLSGAPRAEGEWWFNRLDQVEAAIEAAP